MAVARTALLLAAVAALLCPAAAMHGFLEGLLTRGHDSQAASRSDHNVGKTVADALRLAFGFGSRGDPEGETPVPNADQVFKQYDSLEPHGFLNVQEAEALLLKLGFTKEESGVMVQEMDGDGDSMVSQKEFNTYIQVDPSSPPAPRTPAFTQQQGEVVSTPAPAAPAPAQAAAPAPAKAPAAPVASSSSPTQQATPAPAPAAKTPAAPAASSSSPAQAPPAATAKPTAKPPKPVVDEDANGKMLQRRAARTQDTLVDAVENAQVAEIKRAVFRSMGRLRYAQIKEYDTIARIQTENIDDYNDKHTYRNENPLHYLDEEEGPIDQDKYATFRRRAMTR
mmetsp:Transcript_19504/g.61355  ORF Transcript_19504/g.61355 Transcript_19504/m.61355 type:complete len:338 (+) Transcript_19504:1099-2112(+)